MKTHSSVSKATDQQTQVSSRNTFLVLLLMLPILFSFRVATIPETKPIIILYENDIHCSIDGYSRLAGLRDAIAATDTAWVATVSCGDYLQGARAGALSRGQYVVDIMKAIGYDAITLGNHEFDYGIPRMQELLSQLNTPVLCANLYEYGSSNPCYAAYTIRRYGTRSVAFVGVTTPEATYSERYAFLDFENNKKPLYDLRTGDELYSLVQKAVDAARSEGADYVVLLSHLGEKQSAYGITSHQLIAATRGIDVVLDGHSHSLINCNYVVNIDGKLVPVTQTGSKFANIGKLVIGPDGRISTSIIPTEEIVYESASVNSAIKEVKKDIEKVTSRQLAQCEFNLIADDSKGARLARLEETNLGDLITDAFRHSMQAQIGLFNGGGIRTNISAGTITYGDVTDVQIFDEKLVKIKASGAEILTMLEACTATLPNEQDFFPQVSGLRYTIHMKSHSVSDVAILDDASGEWIPIDSASTYSIALTDYYQRGGFYDTLCNCKELAYSILISRDAIAEYLENPLGGIVPTLYSHPQGRITIVDD